MSSSKSGRRSKSARKNSKADSYSRHVSPPNEDDEYYEPEYDDSYQVDALGRPESLSTTRGYQVNSKVHSSGYDDDFDHAHPGSARHDMRAPVNEYQSPSFNAEAADYKPPKRRCNIEIYSNGIGWQGVKAIVDTGSDENWISKEIVESLSLPINRSLILKYKEAGGSRLASGATVTIRWVIQGRSSKSNEAEFRVVTHGETPFDVLLGNNLIVSNQIDFNDEERPHDVIVGPKKAQLMLGADEDLDSTSPFSTERTNRSKIARRPSFDGLDESYANHLDTAFDEQYAGNSMFESSEWTTSLEDVTSHRSQPLFPLSKDVPNTHATVSDEGFATQALRLSLTSGKIEEVRRLLGTSFDLVVAEGDFAWLSELRDHGYTTEEIAQLLMDEQRDSPWISFEQRNFEKLSIIPDYHQPSCVHTAGKELAEHTTPSSDVANAETIDTRMPCTSLDESLSYIEELSGLAGICRYNLDPNSWHGSVAIDGKHGTMTASVSFLPRLDNSNGQDSGSVPLIEDTNLHELAMEATRNMNRALENLCNAIGHAQRSGLCCDSFTYLYLRSTGSHKSNGKVVELVRIEIAKVQTCREYLLRVQNDASLLGKASTLLQSMFPGTIQNDLATASFMDKVQQACLIVQVLCLAFSSYLKAHFGPFNPFPLDTAIDKIRLCGLKRFNSQGIVLTASLQTLSCLHIMLRSPVLVFDLASVDRVTQQSYDLIASPEDLVDTWGPGQFVMGTAEVEAATGHLTAIMIGGGVIKPTHSTTESNKVLHWSNEVDPHHTSSVRFARAEKVVIAGVVNVNRACQSDTGQIWSSFFASLENLRTTPDYWQYTEFQAGIALMGQQLVGGQVQFNKTWTWHPGNTWKHQYLGFIADNLPARELDRPWGVLVSACTGVARRVTLGQLLADVIPAFAGTHIETPKTWPALQAGIVQALSQGSIKVKEWYDGLTNQPDFQELQSFTRRLIRHILLVLRDTGIDREHKMFRIACPQGHTVGAPIIMCLPIPCEKSSLWAQILTDTEHCATFACMTTLCFESQENKCQTTTPWHCPSLDTAVQQIRSHNEPIVYQAQPWALEIDAMYWIGNPESGLQARVVKLPISPNARLHISKSSIPQKTRARLGAMNRLFPKRDRLRERQIDTWPAEEVLVLSH